MPEVCGNSKAKARQWFRFYAEAVNDPKVQKLPPHLFKTWVNLLCLASMNGGELPKRDDIAFQLRLSDHDAQTQIDELISLGLIDIASNKKLEPHNWKERQFVSDTSGDRVAKHREKRKARGLTKSVWIKKEVRAEVFARDNHACVYCSSTSDLTLDHKTPEIRGGTHDVENLQVACRSCNASKRDMTHEEFVTWNGRVTLHVTEVKRPQNTETDTETDQKTATQSRAALPEISDLKALSDRLHEVAKPCLSSQAIAPGLASMMVPQMWLDQGADLERDVIPTLESFVAKGRRNIGSWDYFTRSVAEAKAKRLRGLPHVEVPSGPPVRKPKSFAQFVAERAAQ